MIDEASHAENKTQDIAQNEIDVLGRSSALVADAAQWRHHVKQASSRREFVHRATHLTGAAAVGAAVGLATKDPLSSYINMRDASLQDIASSGDPLIDATNQSRSVELALGREIVQGERDGWTLSFDLDGLTSAMSKNGLTSLTLDAQYPGAIIDQIPSFTIDPKQRMPESMITTTPSASFDNAQGPTKVRLHLLPLNPEGQVDININTSKGRLLEPLRVDLESQSYELEEGQVQRVYAEEPTDHSQPLSDSELATLQNIADKFTNLGLDAKIFIAEKPNEGKIHYPTPNQTLGEGIILRRSSFKNEDLQSGTHGKIETYHKLARSAMEKLTDRSVHSQDTIDQILNQLEILRRNKTSYEGSLSSREAARNIDAREEGKNILDITENFDRLDVGMNYLKDGKPTQDKTTSLSDANELLASMMCLITFGNNMRFESNFKNLHETQKVHVANIINSGLAIIQKAAVDKGSSLEEMLPDAENYKRIVRGHSD